MIGRIIQGDCRATLATLPDASVQTCVTSPPYWGLRDYGVNGQLGIEETPAECVDNLVGVFREVRRVLRGDGTLWLNLGDKMINKQILGLPWKVAFALRDDGWRLCSDVVWSKPNPIPEPVKDRPARSHEYVFLLSKSEKTFYDAESVRQPASENKPWSTKSNGGTKANSVRNDGTKSGSLGKPAADGKRHLRSVWTIVATKYKGVHVATMPIGLVERCILAGSRVGDSVLDPFSGAGTTGLVAARLQREYIGIELNPEYAETSRRRIERETLLHVANGE